MTKTNNRVVLAYSGGLDTSVILKWLINEGYEVIAYIADVGQKEDFEAARAKAEKIGASKVFVEDLKLEFVKDYIFPAFAGNAVYESRYLQGTAVARPLITKRQVEIAQAEDAAFISHGATGKGNDQVRFELGAYALMPQVEVLAPWKIQKFLDQFKGRSDMLEYAEKHGIPVTATKAKSYSEDENLLHISHEAGELEYPNKPAKEDVYSHTTSPEDAPDKPQTITISFEKGAPTQVEGESDPLKLFELLNELGAKHGIGRLDMVENRFVGIKSRGVYETPGGFILNAALRDLEGLTMDREVLRLRDLMAQKFADLIYNGFWFSPEMGVVRAALDKANEHNSGSVQVKLYKGNAMPIARQSDESLYDERASSMDEEGGFDQKDADGFIKINALRLKAAAKRS